MNLVMYEAWGIYADVNGNLLSFAKRVQRGCVFEAKILHKIRWVEKKAASHSTPNHRMT